MKELEDTFDVYELGKFSHKKFEETKKIGYLIVGLDQKKED